MLAQNTHELLLLVPIPQVYGKKLRFCPERYLPASRLPVAAVQPMTGGIAPTTAPTHVLAMLILFSGV